MTLRNLLPRWFKRPAAGARARKEYLAILYFDGPLTKWMRSKSLNHFEEHPGGLRIPLGAEIMRAPDEREIVQEKRFRSQVCARIWVLARLKGFDTTKLVGEVRPL